MKLPTPDPETTSLYVESIPRDVQASSPSKWRARSTDASRQGGSVTSHFLVHLNLRQQVLRSPGGTSSRAPYALVVPFLSFVGSKIDGHS